MAKTMDSPNSDEARAARLHEQADPTTQTNAGGKLEPLQKRERLLGIQFARGLAALLVVIYHGSRMVALPQYAGHKGFGGFFEFGYAGVDFFFVLS